MMYYFLIYKNIIKYSNFTSEDFSTIANEATLLHPCI